MIFTERIEKLLGANHIKEVIDEFLKFLGDVPQSSRDARADANQLRGQIIVLSGRFTELNTKLNTNTIDPASGNQEKSMIINSFIQILNQLPSSYPDLNRYLEEKNEDDEWKEAQDKNRIEAYQVYFSKYPNGKYKEATIKLIGELEDVKRKQDEEIKRLAMLEKERRENDKAAEAEAQRARKTTGGQAAHKTTAQVNAPPPAKSNKALYIILGALLGIVLLVVVANMASSDEPYTPPKEPASSPLPVSTDVTTAQPQAGLSEAVKSELKLAIRQASANEITAYYTLGTDPLYRSYTGEALKALLSEIDKLKNNDLFASQTLDNQEFLDISVSSDGLQAEVKLIETWTTVYYRISTQQCFSKIPSTKYPQTIFLAKTNNGWLVSSISWEKTVNTEPVPCF